MFRPSTYIALVLVAAAIVVAIYNNRNVGPEGTATTVAGMAKEGHMVEEAWGEHSLLLGKPMPALQLSNWIGPEIKPADMRGRIIVLDFWATWCPPCRAGVPHNNEVSKKYAAQGVLLIGVCGGGGEDKMPQVAKEDGIAYPIAVTTSATQSAWHVKWFPTYAIVDRQGNVRALGIRPEYIERIVDALLKEESPATMPVTRPATRP